LGGQIKEEMGGACGMYGGQKRNAYNLKQTQCLETLEQMGGKAKQTLCRSITGPHGSRRLRIPDFKTIGA
jgi:hypothetical protein